MSDWWNKLLERVHTPKWIKTSLDQWRWSSLGVIGASLIGGCAFLGSTVDSVLTPGKKIDRIELNTEITAWNAQVVAKRAEFEARTKQIDEKDRKKLTIFDTVVATLAGSPIGMTPYFGIAASLVAAGLGIDNIRKDRQITLRDETIAANGKPTGAP